LDTETQVDQEGQISLPLIGRVPVRSLTLDAARTEVVRRYDVRYLINPKVMLTVKTLAPRRYSVLGQVAKPGVFEMPSREKVTLLQAIAMAGGYTRYANQTDVRLRRLTESGEEVLRFDARAMASKAGKEVPILQDDDTITVGESTF
jgi:protein involved in polysaccharide export with SLBB domain